MSPEQAQLAAQVDEVFVLQDDEWVDAYLAELDARDGGAPAAAPTAEDEELMRHLGEAAPVLPRVEDLTDEQILRLWDAVYAAPRRPRLYDWANDPGALRMERAASCLRAWAILAAIVLAVLALVTWGAAA